MFDLDEEGKYFLINNKKVEDLLREVCDLADGLRNLIDEKKNLLFTVRNCGEEIDKNDF